MSSFVVVVKKCYKSLFIKKCIYFFNEINGKKKKKRAGGTFILPSLGKRGVYRPKTAANYKYGYKTIICWCYDDGGEQETDAVATMIKVNLKQMLLLHDGGELETDAVATVMEVNRKQML